MQETNRQIDMWIHFTSNVVHTPFKTQEFLINQMYYNGYQWLRHYTCSGFFKTSYHLLISQPPTNLPNTLKIHTGENKIDRQGRQYTCYFPANGSTNPDVFQPKTFSIPMGIIPQNFRSLGFAVSEDLGNKHPNTQTDSLTDLCFDRVIALLSKCVLPFKSLAFKVLLAPTD